MPNPKNQISYFEQTQTYFQDRNVWFTRNAHRIEHVLHSNVKIHALVPVVSTLNA